MLGTILGLAVRDDLLSQVRVDKTPYSHLENP